MHTTLNNTFSQHVLFLYELCNKIQIAGLFINLTFIIGYKMI